MENFDDILEKYKFQTEGCKRISGHICLGKECKNCFGKSCMQVSYNDEPKKSLCHSKTYNNDKIRAEYGIDHNWICCVSCAKFESCEHICQYINRETKTIKYWKGQHVKV
jgi:hypothetical protein